MASRRACDTGDNASSYLYNLKEAEPDRIVFRVSVQLVKWMIVIRFFFFTNILDMIVGI